MKNIIITEEVKKCILIYANKKYSFINLRNTENKKMDLSSLKENPNFIYENIIYEEKENNLKFKNNELEGTINILKTVQKGHSDLTEEDINFIIFKLFDDLADLYNLYENNQITELDKQTDERFKNISDTTLKEEIKKQIDKEESLKLEIRYQDLYSNFLNRVNIKKAIKDLGNILNKEYKIVLKKDTHEALILNNSNNAYEKISIDEILYKLTYDFETDNLFKTTDISEGLDFISERIEPSYNIVRFNNCLYSMKEHKIIDTYKPILSLIEVPYNYNPEAEPKYILDYLYSTFRRNTKEETEKYIKGVLQVIGYLFTSGNNANTLIFFTGIGGGGKSGLSNIIRGIFNYKVCNLDFTQIDNNNNHATSEFIGCHLNIVSEADNSYIINNTPYKDLTGDEPITVNPKFKQAYQLKKEEVPKTIMNMNNLPRFKHLVPSLLQRFIVIEFIHQFRNTKEAIKDIDKLILNTKQDIEYLIYHSLEAYKEMINKKEDFILRLSEEDTNLLFYKQGEPINYLLEKVILKHDKEAYEFDINNTTEEEQNKFNSPYIINTELNKILVYLARKEGLEVPLNSKGLIKPKLLTKALKETFELEDYYIELENGSKKAYTTIAKKINKKAVRVYPELIKTDLYNQILKKIQ